MVKSRFMLFGIRRVIGGLLAGFWLLVTLGSTLLTGWGGIFPLMLAIFFSYLSFGIDWKRKKIAKGYAESYLKESNRNELVSTLADIYVPDFGRGHVCISDRWFIVIDRKGNVHKDLAISSINSYLIENAISIFAEKDPSITIYYTDEYGKNKSYEFVTMSYKKIESKMVESIKVGVAGKEKQENKNNLEHENELILKNIDWIMNTEFNEEAGGTFFQNSGYYQKVFMETAKESFPKLNALSDTESQYIDQYFITCMMRGHKMALVALTAHGYQMDKSDEVTLPQELIIKHFNQSKNRHYPSLERIVYSQYKFYRNNNIQFLREEDVILLTKEAILLGFKNTWVNYQAYSEMESNKIGVSS